MSFPAILSWCPGQTPPAKCDICAPIGIAWPAAYLPNLKTAYFRYPGLFLWNPDDYVAQVQVLSSNACTYTTSGHSASTVFSAQRIAIISYPPVPGSDPNTEWFLNVAYSFVPDPPPTYAPPDTIWTVTGSYSWIGFQYANAGYLAVTHTDPVNQFR